MPGAGGDSLQSAVSTAMKRCHPGMWPKLGKADRHLLRVTADPRLKLARRALVDRIRRLILRKRLLTDDGGVFSSLEAEIAALTAASGTDAAKVWSYRLFASLGAASGGANPILSVFNHGPPPNRKACIPPLLRLPSLRSLSAKIISAALIGSILSLGSARKSEAAPYAQTQDSAERAELAKTSLPPAKALNLDYAGTALVKKTAAQAQIASPRLDPTFKLPTQQEMYDSYMQQGIEYSQKGGDENRQKAMEYFAKAISLDMKKALMLKTESLDAKTREIYSNALMGVQFANMTEEKAKEKKGLSALAIGGIVIGSAAALLGIEYLVGDPLHIRGAFL